ncbi:hypothetical protein BDB00DRAFT_794816 [Zychaea mexicana]|uniref:uncharacterized protein n=1 Tax=Zychaea mexicana TaxID=64656 RepID=UPI0022FDBDB4|nr:uncharacterized protein BDB00DRAFT_794816 [Zychaea mexicana]KAI9499614.1 hypothetical protein BDB00DRAFT_794816 [Zychaea mexicana]
MAGCQQLYFVLFFIRLSLLSFSLFFSSHLHTYTHTHTHNAPFFLSFFLSLHSHPLLSFYLCSSNCVAAHITYTPTHTFALTLIHVQLFI